MIIRATIDQSDVESMIRISRTINVPQEDLFSILLKDAKNRLDRNERISIPFDYHKNNAQSGRR